MASSPQFSNISSPSPGNMNSTHFTSSINSCFSDGDVCRICHCGPSTEPLLSPCYCTGTMGRFHVSCLQKWLGVSNKSQCEICHFNFSLVKRTKPFYQFFRNPGTARDRRNLFCDAVCFCILVPLTSVTVWLCFHSASYLPDDKWERVGIHCLGVILMLLLSVWIAVCTRHNISQWRTWKQFNQIVTLKCEPPSAVERQGQIGSPARSCSSKMSSKNGTQLESITIQVERKCCPGPAINKASFQPYLAPLEESVQLESNRSTTETGSSNHLALPTTRMTQANNFQPNRTALYQGKQQFIPKYNSDIIPARSKWEETNALPTRPKSTAAKHSNRKLDFWHVPTPHISNNQTIDNQSNKSCTSVSSDGYRPSNKSCTSGSSDGYHPNSLTNCLKHEQEVPNISSVRRNLDIQSHHSSQQFRYPEQQWVYGMNATGNHEQTSTSQSVPRYTNPVLAHALQLQERSGTPNKVYKGNTDADGTHVASSNTSRTHQPPRNTVFRPLKSAPKSTVCQTNMSKMSMLSNNSTNPPRFRAMPSSTRYPNHLNLSRLHETPNSSKGQHQSSNLQIQNPSTLEQSSSQSKTSTQIQQMTSEDSADNGGFI